MSVFPRAGRGIRGNEEDEKRDRHDNDKRNSNEGNAPCDVWSMSPGDKRIQEAFALEYPSQETYAGITKYVTPPPALPHPAARAFARPTQFLSKKPVHQT